MVKLNKKIRRYLALVLCLSILLVPVEGYAAKNNQSTNQRVRTTTTAAGWVSSGGRGIEMQMGVIRRVPGN